MFCVAKWSFGTEHFVRYNQVFVKTEFIIIEFHFISKSRYLNINKIKSLLVIDVIRFCYHRGKTNLETNLSRYEIRAKMSSRGQIQSLKSNSTIQVEISLL